MNFTKNKKKKQDEITKSIISNLSKSKLFGRDLNQDQIYFSITSGSYVAIADNKKQAAALKKEMENQGLDAETKKTGQVYKVIGEK